MMSLVLNEMCRGDSFVSSVETSRLPSWRMMLGVSHPCQPNTWRLRQGGGPGSGLDGLQNAVPPVRSQLSTPDPQAVGPRINSRAAILENDGLGIGFLYAS